MQTWSSFKAQTGDGRFQNAFQAIDAAVRHLTARLDGNVTSIMLFGSLARRRSTYDDIDLLIVTGPVPGSISEVTRRFAEEIFGPLFLEYDELFSFIVYTENQLAQLRDTLPLLDEIRREGVLLYGEDPFAEAAGSGVPADRSPSTGYG
jgi:predicted nucleotidyltransferase